MAVAAASAAEPCPCSTDCCRNIPSRFSLLVDFISLLTDLSVSRVALGNSSRPTPVVLVAAAPLPLQVAVALISASMFPMNTDSKVLRTVINVE